MTIKIEGINAKFLAEQNKRGISFEELAKLFDVECNALEKAIRKNISKNAADYYIRELKGNKKLHKKNQGKKVMENETAKDTEKEIVDCDIPSIEEYTEDIDVSVDAIPTPEESTIEPSSNSRQEKIEEIEAVIADIREELNRTELKHKGFSQKRDEINKKLYKHKESLVEIYQKISNIEDAVSELLSEIDKTVPEMISCNEKCNELRNEIAEYEEQLKNLKKVCYIVYDTGVIETDSGEEVDIPDTWKSIYSIIIYEDELGLFTTNQLRALAKAIALLKCDGDNAEFLFESEILEELLHKYAVN